MKLAKSKKEKAYVTHALSLSVSLYTFLKSSIEYLVKIVNIQMDKVEKYINIV